MKRTEIAADSLTLWERVRVSFIPFLLIFLIGIVTYLPSLNAQLFWDDDDFILNNQYVKEFRIDKFFLSQAVEGSGKVSNYFRPIQFTTYAVVYKLFGPNAVAFHATSIFIHILAALSLYLFLSTLLLPIPYALLSTLMFLIHPIQTEAVSYVSGLSDPLVALFGFLSLMFFTLSLRGVSQETTWQSYPLLSLFFFTFALLSKESAVIFLGLLGLLYWFQRIKNKKSSLLSSTYSILLTLLPYILMTLVYLLYHRNYIDTVDMKTIWGDGPYTQSVVVRLSMFLSILPKYIVAMVFPLTLFYERDFTLTILTTPWHLPSVITFCIIVVIGVTLALNVVNKQKNSQFLTANYLLLTAFLSFFISMVPFSGLALINGVMYEHFLYIALPFFFLFVSVLLFQRVHHLILLMLLIPVIPLLITRSWFRQSDWQDPIRFYKQTLSHAHKSFRVWNNLGMVYDARNQYPDAIQSFESAIQINPDIPNSYHNIGNIYLKEKNYQKAEELFQKAITVDPNFGYSYSALVELYQHTGETEKLKQISEEIVTRFRTKK